MTEFEQQVAEALERPIWILINVSGDPKEIAKELAPRVAAAIDVVLKVLQQEAENESDAESAAAFADKVREQAVATLRGQE